MNLRSLFEANNGVVSRVRFVIPYCTILPTKDTRSSWTPFRAQFRILIQNEYFWQKKDSSSSNSKHNPEQRGYMDWWPHSQQAYGMVHNNNPYLEKDMALQLVVPFFLGGWASNSWQSGLRPSTACWDWRWQGPERNPNRRVLVGWEDWAIPWHAQIYLAIYVMLQGAQRTCRRQQIV